LGSQGETPLHEPPLGAPHTFAVPPPPQVAGAVQVPQLLTLRAAPQLSVPETLPQFFASRAQNAVLLSGTQEAAENR
jgi:hypothetical protein